MMQKNQNLFFAFALLCFALIVTVGCNGDKKKLEEAELKIKELEELAELDKLEMENQYAEFALQYDELKRGIKDDSLIAQLDKEQRRSDSLLAELKRVKSSNAAEIKRLKKELASVRAVLRSYILQVDSLQQLNQALTSERDKAREKYREATVQISDLNSEREQLTEQVAIAAQLNATNIAIEPTKKNGKEAKRCKDIKNFNVSFTITRNVTAEAGNRTAYVRLMKPNNTVVNAAGSFEYENKTIECSASKVFEYTGQEQRLTVYIPVSEYLSAGKYTAFIFVDGQMVGTNSITMNK